jgi:hypothetical protein
MEPIRINLKIDPKKHPDLHAYLSQIPKENRAYEIKKVSTAGLLNPHILASSPSPIPLTNEDAPALKITGREVKIHQNKSGEKPKPEVLPQGDPPQKSSQHVSERDKKFDAALVALDTSF